MVESCLILFDGDCGFCNGVVRFLLRRDRRGRLFFVPSRSEAGALLMTRHHLPPQAVAESLHVFGAHGVAVRSAAFLQIARRLPCPWRLAAGLQLIPTPLRDAVYRLIAQNRRALPHCALVSPMESRRIFTTAAELDAHLPRTP